MCVCVYAVWDQSIILNGNESLLLFAVMSVQKRVIINNIMGGSELSRERRDLVSVVVHYMPAVKWGKQCRIAFIITQHCCSGVTVFVRVENKHAIYIKNFCYADS